MENGLPAPIEEYLYKSRSLVARRQVNSLAFVVVDGEIDQDPVVDGRVDLGSIVPRWLFSSPASLDPGAPVLRARPD